MMFGCVLRFFKRNNNADSNFCFASLVKGATSVSSIFQISSAPAAVHLSIFILSNVTNRNGL